MKTGKKGKLFQEVVEEYLETPTKRLGRSKSRQSVAALNFFANKKPLKLKDPATGKTFRYTEQRALNNPSLKVLYDPLSGCFKDREMKSINSLDVNKVRNKLMTDKGLGFDGVGNYLKYLRALINFAEDTCGVVFDAKPKIVIQKGERRKFALTKQQATIFLDHLDDLRSDMFRMCLATGQRNTNIRMMQWEWINPTMTEIVIPKKFTKNGKALQLFLNEISTAVLQRRKEIYVDLVAAHPARVSREYVFIQTSGNHIGKPFYDPSSVTNDSWKSAIGRANDFIDEENKKLSVKKQISRLPVRGFVFHTGRHTFATWHLIEGTEAKELMEAGGWLSLASVIDYQQVSDEHMKKVSSRITF